MITFGKLDMSKTFAGLDNLQKKQLPFAVANCLTQTAKQASDENKKHLRSVFTLRNDWTERGMTFKPAKKTDRSPTALVIAGRPYLDLQEFGGDKVAHNGHKYIAVPMRTAMGISNNQLIPASLRPANLIASGKGFIVDTRDGRHFLFVRAGFGSGKRRYETIVPAYVLVNEVHVKSVLDFQKITRDYAVAHLASNFADAFDLAMRTAK